MKTLFIQPPITVNRDHIDYPAMISYAMWQNAAHLSSAGFDVVIRDAFQLPFNLETIKEPYRQYGADLDRLFEDLELGDFDAIVVHLDVFSLQAPAFGFIPDLLGIIRKGNPDALLILADLHVGGMHYLAYDPTIFLKAEYAPDIVLRYEAEESLANILTNLKETSSHPRGVIDGLPLSGLLSSYNGAIYSNLDLGAFGAGLTNILKQEGHPNPFGLTPETLPFKTSRGCCYSCSFCTGNPGISNGQSGSWRSLNADEMTEEIARLGAINEVKKLWVLDEAANISPQHFDRFLDAVETVGLEIEFPNGLRADALSEDQVNRLSKLVTRLSLSPESGTDDVISRLIGKRQSLESVERVCEWAAHSGLPVALHFIVGLPGELKRETAATFAYAKRMAETYGAEPWMQFAVALPGTSLYEECEKNNLLPDPLPTDFGPLFQGEPMLKDGACEFSNAELVRLKRALMAALHG